jgi:hypothetical protein
MIPAVAALGQIERFPAMRLNARYMIRDETPAGTLGKERAAPIPAV